MPIIGFEQEKCVKRNRLAAKRDGVNSTPINLFTAPPKSPSGHKTITAKGALPKTDEDALSLINTLLDTPLTLDDIYIHYMEAANSNFIGDRFMFLDSSTLRNIASQAANGFAFMNSHRTGGLSHPAELPFGRTFAGRYEHLSDDNGNPFYRSVVGFYMLRGQQPNGGHGPSTDSLHQAIEGGTIFDVSVGLWGGENICDVCAGDVSDFDVCSHVPGTTDNMSKTEIAAQSARGVPGGKASYTLVDANCGETSAVYDGAVPGAGFRKALSASKKGDLSKSGYAEARESYAKLLSKGDLMDTDNILLAIKTAFTEVLQSVGFKPKSEDPTDEIKTDVPGAPGNNTADPALSADGSGETKPMSDKTTRLELAGAFSKLGSNALAAAVAGASDDTPDTLAKAINAHFSIAINEAALGISQRSANDDDILRMATAKNITNADQFKSTLESADLGIEYASQIRGDAKKQAVRALGAVVGQQLAKSCDDLPVLSVRDMANGWRASADKMFGFAQDGTPPPKTSAGKQIETVSLNADVADDADSEKEAADRRAKYMSMSPLGKQAAKANAAA